jgi:VWFA-related protein
VLLMAAGAVLADDHDVVFRSDVSLVRVDAQVVDHDNRAIGSLNQDDFAILEEGKKQAIKAFEKEDMPVDVILLLDVSASMEPHIARISAAAHEALQVLGEQDRVGIMVFDRQTRTRLTLRRNRADVENELERLLHQEGFNGGTDITRGLLDAAAYIGREGRKDARRAIVIVTDDQTERDRNEELVNRALAKADAVLMAILAPDAMGQYGNGGYGRHGGRYPSGGGTWPGGGGGGWPGGGMGWPGGGIGFPRGGSRYPGGGYPGGGGGGGGYGGPHTKSAGTAEIAMASGGDSTSINQASAFEDMLERIRQRYSLHFALPEGVKPGEERQIEVQLSSAARRRYPEAEVRYRRVYLTPDGSYNDHSSPVRTSRTSTPDPADNSSASGSTSTSSSTSSSSKPQRRRAVDESSGPRVLTEQQPAPAPAAAPQAADQPASTPAETTPSKGWRRVNEQPTPPAPSTTDPKP